MPVFKSLIRLLPQKQIQIGKTSSEIDGVGQEYFETKDSIRVLAKCTPDCEYPVLQREIPPTQILCPVCKEVTLAGLEHCDKCGSKIVKEVKEENKEETK